MIGRVVREPALILGVVTAGLSLAVLFGAPLSAEQIAGVGVFVGALVALLRFVTTPSNEVLAQVKPSGEVVAGKATTLPTGQALEVDDTGDPAVVLPIPVDPDAP